MIFAYVALFLLCLYKAKVSVKSFNTGSCLSMDATNSVRGVFIMLVLLSHFSLVYTYVAPLDLMGKRISRILGQLIVVMFLFYSGYGVCEAIKKKGSGYVKQFPKNRVLKTLLHFDIGVLVFLAVGLLSGKRFEIKNILLSLLGWENVGNSHWYIFSVLFLYIATWIAFSVFKKNNAAAASVATLLTVAYVLILRIYQPYWWYDTVLCYALGMWFSFGKEKFLPFVTKNNLRWVVITAITTAATLFSHFYSRDLPWRISEALFFAAAFVMITLKITVNNKILAWLGRHTFEIYILMYIPMRLLKQWGLGEINLYLAFFASLAATLLLAWGFAKLMNAIDKRLFKKPAVPQKTA